MPVSTSKHSSPVAAAAPGTHSSHTHDGHVDAVFDDVAQLATLVCQVPMAVIILTADAAPHFRAQAGVDSATAATVHSFCQAVAQTGDALEVADAKQMPQLAKHPAVTGAPKLRFAASAPLYTPEGMLLGNLCVLNTQPQQLAAAQRDGLRLLARQVTAQLLLRRVQQHVADERRTLEGVLRLTNGTIAQPANARPEVFIKADHRLNRVMAADVHYVEALGDYVNIYTGTMGRITLYATMKEMELKLPPTHFARVHRKHIANLDRILLIEGDMLHMDVGRPGHPSEIPIGSSYKSALLHRLNVL